WGAALAHSGELAAARRAEAAPGRAGLRGVPRGLASAGWGAARHTLPRDTGPRNRRRHRGAGAAGHTVPHRRSRGGAVARLHLRRMRLLPLGAGESVRAGALYRLYA